jgi:hypothetical protein
MSTNRKWLDNSFWHNEEKEIAEAILVITDSEGREISQVLTVRKFDTEGNLNPDWEELLDQLGEEKIDANTEERRIRKAKESEVHEQERKANMKARQLEELFDAKIALLEVEEIQNTENKKLKSKLRRSKSILEMHTYASLIMMEEIGVEFTIKDKD